MRKVKKPRICSKTLFESCATRIRNTFHRQCLLSHSSEVVDLGEEYEKAAERFRLCFINVCDVFWDVPSNTWNNLYRNHMAKLGGVAREQYDEIRLAPVANTCPFCSVRPVQTVDHFLPKSRFPQYSVMPANLVGCCQGCNADKDDSGPDSPEMQLFHPYFDSMDGRWLVAEVKEECPPAATFYVSQVSGRDQAVTARLKHQFKILKLGSLYSANAANELSSIEFQIRRLHEGPGGEKKVRDYLSDAKQSASDAAYPVEWKVALYEALAESTWYCNGGFTFKTPAVSNSKSDSQN